MSTGTIREQVRVIPAGADSDGVLELFADLDEANRVVFEGGSYQIDTQLTIDQPGITVDAARASIEQTTQGLPVFDVLHGADDATITARRLLTATQRWISAPVSDVDFRGERVANYSAGIYTNAARGRFRARVEGFYCAAFASNWNGTALDPAVMRESNRFDLLVSGVDMGLSAQGFEGMEIDIRGTYSPSAGSPHPSHALYVTDRVPSKQLVGRVIAWGGTGGHVAQVKRCAGGQLWVLGRACEGLLSLAAITDFQIPVYAALDDVPPATGTVYMQHTGEQRVRFGTGHLRLATPGRAMRLGGDDTTLGDTYIDVEENASADTHYVYTQGNRCDHGRMRIHNRGTGGRRAIGIESGDGHIVRDLTTRGVRCVVDVLAAATNTIVEIDPHKTGLAASNVGRVVDGSTTTIRGDLRQERVLSGWVTGATVAGRTLTLGQAIGPFHIHSVDIFVDTAFNSDGTDQIRVGHDVTPAQFAALTDVSTTGQKTPGAGSQPYRFQTPTTATTIKAYYVAGGSAPTTGKALVVVRYSNVPATP